MTTAIRPDEPLHLVAFDRPELEAAHAQMIEWAKARRDKVDVDADVESTNLDIAARNGWLTAPFERRLNTLARQRLFYDKIIAALVAGYAIVPNFPMTVLAVRTKAATPRGKISQSHWERFAQPAQLLPEGEGRYRNPEPQIYQRIEKNVPDGNGGTKSITHYWPEDYNDIEFPLTLARPEVMTRVGQAMALKLFDQIGVVEDRVGASGGKGDPVFVGRLLNPKKGRSAITFYLAWYFDPSRL